MKQDEKRFVNKLDFLTTPGYLDGPGTREKMGLPANTGPWRVVTQFGIYGFDTDKEMILLSKYPFVCIEEIRKKSSFPIKIVDNISYLNEPTVNELEILRNLDPYGIVISKKTE
jgi:3-oxoacid CoA-transferase subunit B/glutaconate CoA-transferase subunit B